MATMYAGIAAVVVVNFLIIAFILQHYVGDFSAVFGRANWGGDPSKVITHADSLPKTKAAEDVKANANDNDNKVKKA